MIIIKSQDDKSLHKCVGVFIGKEDNQYVINGNTSYLNSYVPLGYYPTEERAKEIVEVIYDVISISKGTPLIKMPEE